MRAMQVEREREREREREKERETITAQLSRCAWWHSSCVQPTDVSAGTMAVGAVAAAVTSTAAARYMGVCKLNEAGYGVARRIDIMGIVQEEWVRFHSCGSDSRSRPCCG